MRHPSRLHPVRCALSCQLGIWVSTPTMWTLLDFEHCVSPVPAALCRSGVLSNQYRIQQCSLQPRAGGSGYQTGLAMAALA